MTALPPGPGQRALIGNDIGARILDLGLYVPGLLSVFLTHFYRLKAYFVNITDSPIGDCLTSAFSNISRV